MDSTNYYFVITAVPFAKHIIQ